MAISQTQALMAEAAGYYGAPARGTVAMWAGDAAVPALPLGEAKPPAVPPVPTVSYALRAFPLLPAGLPDLAGLPKNSVVKGTPFTVRGRPFGDQPLADYCDAWGATVTSAAGSATTFVIDFHATRSIRRVTVGEGGPATFKLWAGVQFSDQNANLAQLGDWLTQKIEVTLSSALSAARFVEVTRIDCGNYPLNVRFVLAEEQPAQDAEGKPIRPEVEGSGGMKLFSAIPFAHATGKEPVLWTFNGELTATATLPDFSRELNAFLEASPADQGLCFPRLIAYADAPGFLEIDAAGGSPYVSLNYVLTVEFGGDDPLSTSVTFSRHGDVKKVGLVLFPMREGQLVTPPGVSSAAPRVRVQNVHFGFSGAMDADRLDPDLYHTERQVPAAARVSSAFSLAMPLDVAAERQLAGLDLFLQAEAGATLTLELQGDHAGGPDGTAAAAAAVDVAAVADAPGWVSARFAEPVRLAGGATVWAVLKARAGAASWLADAGGPDEQGWLRFSRDGTFWSAHTPSMIGLYKLKVLPPAAERKGALTVDLLERTGLPLQVTETPRTAAVLFEDDEGVVLDGSIALRLIPESAGRVQLTAVVAEYVPLP